MGMAASQVRLLQLTNRNNSIHRQLMSLSMSKMDLTRDMQKVTKEYQQALSSKTLKWSPNNGVTQVDMSYANLMRPGSLNGNKPYIITDNHDKVVIDSQYLDYAKMISEDGKPGDWASVRTEVLASLTGIDAEKIGETDGLENAVNDNYKALQEIKAKEPSSSRLEKDSTSELLSKLSGNIAEKYASGEEFEAAFALSYLTSLQGLSKYFGAYEDKFKDAWKSVVQGFQTEGNTNKYTVQDLVNLVSSAYKSNGGCCSETADANGNKLYNPIWFEVDSAEYKNWQTEHAAWEQQYESAKSDYDTSVNGNSMLLTAAEESEIEFYDNLFSTIAEKGWSCNEKVSNTDYLSQMLINGMYTITTTERTKTESEDTPGEYVYSNKYSENTATNCKNFVLVNDTDANSAALAKYEYEKSVISAKEETIDTKMKNFETEQSAIKQMMESIKNVINKNIETNLNIFG